MRKIFGIASICIFILLGVLGWRYLPIEGETRSLFFAKGRVPDEIGCLLDIESLEFVSFSKISDEVKTTYLIIFKGKPDFDTVSLDSSLAASGWICSGEMLFADERIRYYIGNDLKGDGEITVTIHDEWVKFTYLVTHSFVTY